MEGVRKQGMEWKKGVKALGERSKGTMGEGGVEETGERGGEKQQGRVVVLERDERLRKTGKGS